MFQDTAVPTPAGERAGVSPWRVALVLTAGVAWAALIAGEARFGLAGLCGRAAATLGNGFGWDRASLRLALTANPPLRLALPWALMVVAMMAPLLAIALGRADRRAPFIDASAFAVAYGAVWLLAGLVLIPSAVLLGAAAGPAAATIALATALAWQAAPGRRRWLAHCRCPAEGRALAGGLSAGLACLGTCWAAMLVPLVAGGGHLAAMAAISLFLVLERRQPA